MSQPAFYTQSNLDKWARWTDTSYDPIKNKTERDWIQKNLKPQLDHWYKKLLLSLPGYIKKGSLDWLDRDRRHFRHYMWMRLLPAKHNPELYFTIGIDHDAGSGIPGLVIKIDFHREAKAALSKTQRDFLSKMLVREDGGVAWHEISLTKVKSWEQLMTESLDFIKTYESYYLKCLEGIQNMSESYRVSRITWNDLGWVRPSGKAGKSALPNTHEGREGYGHEEWLLDTSKIIDGYHYGFLEPIHKQYQAYVNKKYDIGLYSICAEEKSQYFWIGRINNVEVIDWEEAKRIKAVYKKKGWMDEMKHQLREVGGNMGNISSWTNGQLFNVRFRVDDMHIEGYQPLPSDHPICRITRYTFLKGEEILDDIIPDSDFNARAGEPSENVNGNSGYEREPRFVQVTQKHRKLQKLLVRKLKSEFGKNNVTWEHLLSNGTQVDVVRKSGDKIVYYEIKTYSSMRVSIREAMGQLLEYAHWGTGQIPAELVIVSDLDPGDGMEYIRKLRDVYHLPINYQRLDVETGQLFELLF
jgi:hypothetical protein